MLLPIIAVVIGLVVLVWSADKFVDGACGVAKFFGISPFLIGMVIVGFGTSAPEMLVSATSAIEGSPNLALGNAYGSNIANIALILGVAAIVNPIKVDKSLMKKELPFLLLTIPLTVVLILDGQISRIDAVILLAVFLVIMVISLGKKEELSEDAENGETVSIFKSLFWLVLGLGLLISSSKALVWAAQGIAVRLGISELIIGLTIVALGTSLPELASSVSAARKNEHEVAFGNVVGSNLFNTLCVVGIAAAIAPVASDPKILMRDMPVVAVLTLLLFVFAARQKISRISGVFLVAVYFAYNTLIALGII